MNRFVLVLWTIVATCACAGEVADKLGICVSPGAENDPDYCIGYSTALDTLKGHARTVWLLERWRRIETKEGEYDWSSLDRRVNEAVKRGFDVGLRLQLVLCGNDAQHHHVAVSQMPAYLGKTMDSDAFRTAVVRFYAAAAQRYKGKAKYVAVGNSVNKYFEQHPEDWAGFKKVYAQIVDAIHAADPKMLVMSDLVSGEEFFTGGKDMAKYTDFFRDSNDDAAGYLFYYISGVYYGSDFAKFGAENMNAALDKIHGWEGKKPVYIIETSCFSTHPKNGTDMSAVQAQFVDLLLTAAQRKDWLLGISWWLLYDAKNLPQVPWDAKASFGLFTAEGKPKPAWDVWKKFADTAAAAK